MLSLIRYIFFVTVVTKILFQFLKMKNEIGKLKLKKLCTGKQNIFR